MIIEVTRNVIFRYQIDTNNYLYANAEEAIDYEKSVKYADVWFDLGDDNIIDENVSVVIVEG